MSDNTDKARTIKIDIRSLGYGRTPVFEGSGGGGGAAAHFDSLDYRFFFEQSYDAILLTDAGGLILAANERAVGFFGYSDVGLSGCSIRVLIAGVTESLLADVQGVIAQGRYMRIQAFAVRRDGQFTAVEVVVMGNRVKAPDRVCYLVRDIQSRWSAEQKLLSAYHAMDNTDSGIGIVRLDGTVSYANRSMVQLLANGGGETAVVGRKLDVWFDCDAVIGPMLKNIAKRQAWSGEQRIISGAQTTWLMLSAIPDVNEDQELCGMVFSIRDTADRRRAEIAEYQVERNRIMMESLAGVCHALGQPATVLLTSIELLKLGGVRDEQTRKEMVDLCYEAVIQLRDLLQKMNAKRMYASEPYLPSGKISDAMVNLEESGPSAEGCGGGADGNLMRTGQPSDLRAGFTVAEVVVASAIMVIVLTAVMGTLSFARRSQVMISERLGALHVARQVMESIANLSYYATEMDVGTTYLTADRMCYYVVTENTSTQVKDVRVVVRRATTLGSTQEVALTTSFCASLHQ